MVCNERDVTVVIPAKNEADTIGRLVEKLIRFDWCCRVIVVDDGSDDATARVAALAGAETISHRYSMGNGAAVKTGLRASQTDITLLMDGDGQHRPEDAAELVALVRSGYDLAVGARHSSSQASHGRLVANTLYNKLATFMTGHSVKDLTSGFRAVRTSLLKEFLHLLPNGFSYPTTSTMAFFRAGYSVVYHPIFMDARVGKGHIKPIRDGIRFLLVIFKIGTLYSPLKIFFPVSCGFFGLGLIYYFYTFVTIGRFTNMSMLLFSSAVIVFLIGLVSEQITNLMYARS